MAALLEGVIVSFLPAIAVVEMALASPLPSLFGALAEHGGKSMRLVTSARVSDHWKERVLPVYALIMLRASLLILLWLSGLLMVFALGIYAGAWLFADNFQGFAVLLRPDYALASLVIALAYLAARRMIARHV